MTSYFVSVKYKVVIASQKYSSICCSSAGLHLPFQSLPDQPRQVSNSSKTIKLWSGSKRELDGTYEV